jgi:hypothetical protein
MKVNYEKDPAKQKAMTQEAEALKQRGLELQKKQQTSAGTAAPRRGGGGGE